ncbi:MAG: isoprenyl transferase [Proteobacteria bacterium]|nr:MAG: isoprenyl transferase [Pseudomonadota bacterium]
MSQLPRHIAIIMDGNGRWAEKRRHNRIFGHTRGVERARVITRECAKLGLEALTLYTFSTENWQRPALEVNFLMKLLLRYLKHETQEIIDNNLRFRALGVTTMLPENIQAELARLTQATAQNTGMILNIALSYGSRQEITAACQRLSAKVAAGTLKAEEITEAAISAELYTHESPDPDLMIRTGGDQRISNFLLWQAAYAELYFTERCWPDFSLDDLAAAIKDFESRERRFGKVMHEPRA